MAAINQAEAIESLQALATTQDHSEFIFGFIDAYGYLKATITQLHAALKGGSLCLWIPFVRLFRALLTETIIRYRMNNTTGIIIKRKEN